MGVPPISSESRGTPSTSSEYGGTLPTSGENGGDPPAVVKMGYLPYCSLGPGRGYFGGLGRRRRPGAFGIDGCATGFLEDVGSQHFQGSVLF